MADEETTVDDLLAEIKPREAEARVLLRQDLLIEHRALCAELEATILVDEKENRDPLAPAIAQGIVDLEAEIDAARRVFRFRAIGRRSWKSLLGKHPPLKEQRQQFGLGLDHNPDTFPVAAIAASCVSPKMTVEQVAKFDELIDISEWNKLWGACLDANTGGDDNPKSLAAGRIVQLNGLYVTTPADSASRALSSQVG